MTVVENQRTREQYTSDGTGVSFPFRARLLDISHLKVVATRGSSNVELTLNTDYTVSGTETDGIYPDGVTVVLNSAEASGNRITLYREVPDSQLTDYINFSTFPAESHEAALDKLTMLVQDLKRQIDRALTVSETYPADSIQLPDPDPGKGWVWSPDGVIQNTEFDLETEAIEARGFRDQAATSATEAATSATNAATSETNAATSETNAAASATSAQQNADRAVARDIIASNLELGYTADESFASQTQPHNTFGRIAFPVRSGATSDYNTTTGVYTVPEEGYYWVNVVGTAFGVDVNTDSERLCFEVYMGNRSFEGCYISINATNGSFPINLSQIRRLSANDLIYARYEAWNEFSLRAGFAMQIVRIG